MMDPSKSPNLAVYSLGMASGQAVDVQPLGWLPALPGQLLGDGVKYYQIGTDLNSICREAQLMIAGFPRLEGKVLLKSIVCPGHWRRRQ